VTMTDRITANLPARDFAATIAFYARLGFAVDYHDPGWLIMSRGTLELEFFPWPDLDPASSSFSACVRVADLPGLYRAWDAAGLPSTGIPRMEPIRAIMPDLHMFALIDEDGSLLRVLDAV
jgi:catechol 2,3-dioxygenase-like lactoylglutathione lyase family enzyme